MSYSSSESKSSSQSDVVEVQHASVGKKTPGTAGVLRFTRNKQATPTYPPADPSWVRASPSSEHEAVVPRQASTAMEETSKKSDSPNTRADIKWWTREAAANKIAGRDANAVDTNQLAENQPAENSWLAEARERTRKKAESSAPRREPSSSSSESSAA